MKSKTAKAMVHGSLFSGIGGFDLAARIVGWSNAFSCEIDPFCNRVLKFHFPDETHLQDIRNTDFSLWRGLVDVLSGGFPCQPFSQAGKRKGTDDSRHLWPAMLTAIRAIRPRWVVGENVLGIVNWSGGMVFEQVCADLEAEGYCVQPFVLPACGVDAPHRRYRTFFIAYAEGNRNTGEALEVCPAHGRPLGAVLSKPDKPSAVWRPSEDPNRDGRRNHHRQEEPRERQHRDVGTGDSERIYLPKGNTADTHDSRDRTSECHCLPDREEDGEERKQSFARTCRFSEISTDTESVRRDGRYSQSDGADGNQTQRPYIFGGTSGSGRERTSSDPASQRCERAGFKQPQYCETQQRESGGGDFGTAHQWYGTGVWSGFPTVAPVCRGDDGLSDRLDPDAVFEGIIRSPRATPFKRWRTESVKAYGNAVVVPLIVQIFRAIVQFEKLYGKIIIPL